MSLITLVNLAIRTTIKIKTLVYIFIASKYSSYSSLDTHIQSAINLPVIPMQFPHPSSLSHARTAPSVSDYHSILILLFHHEAPSLSWISCMLNGTRDAVFVSLFVAMLCCADAHVHTTVPFSERLCFDPAANAERKLMSAMFALMLCYAILATPALNRIPYIWQWVPVRHLCYTGMIPIMYHAVGLDKDLQRIVCRMYMRIGI